MKVKEVFQTNWLEFINQGFQPSRKNIGEITRCSDIYREHGFTYDSVCQLFSKWAGQDITAYLEEIFQEYDHNSELYA